VPDFGAVAPFRSDELVEIFGSATPTPERIQTEIEQNAFSNRLERWHGRVVIGYGPDGVPQTIHFVGFSGGLIPQVESPIDEIRDLSRDVRILARPEYSVFKERRGQACAT
jgi:hypothetical protein